MVQLDFARHKVSEAYSTHVNQWDRDGIALSWAMANTAIQPPNALLQQGCCS